jgi:uncharacterized protein
MLGRLARWLRVLGFDAAYDATASDRDLVQRALDEDRILLTRDRHLLRELRPPRALEIQSDVPLKQLREVIGAFAVEAPTELFTRCLLCNVPLADVPNGERSTVVPARSRDLSGPVRRCAQCGRVYWPGSHVRRMSAALADALPGWIS